MSFITELGFDSVSVYVLVQQFNYYLPSFSYFYSSRSTISLNMEQEYKLSYDLFIQMF